MENGQHSSPCAIPQIIVTDYDAEFAHQQDIKHETKKTDERDPASESSKSSPNPSVVTESEEEDREIIESLTKAHSTNFERHVDVDEMIASTVAKSETTNQNFMPEILTEKKELRKDFATDDDMADMEVSHITSLLESKNKFVPLPGSILNLQRPTVSFVAQPPERKMENGQHSSPCAIPQIIVTDYDAEFAHQQDIKHETKKTDERDPASESLKSSPNPSVVTESKEEDREIIESLTKAHSTNFERHVDVDEMIASTVVKSETTNQNFMPEILTEKKELRKDFATDDDMADMEVSHITSLLESKNKFVPLPGSILNLQRPTVSFVAQPPERKMENGQHSSPCAIPQIIVTDYDAEFAHQQDIKHETKKTDERDPASESLKSSPNPSVVTESKEEDREIIESLTKAHSTNFERHVDVDEMIASTVVKSETTNQNFMPEILTEKKELRKDFATDDDMADMEVSHITSLLESKNKFVPLPGSILNLQRPTVSFVAQPPGALPNISDVNLPRLVPGKIELSTTDPSDMLAEFHFPPLREMSFSAEAQYNTSECLPCKPTNGANKLKNRKTARLCGESESDSQYSSSSSSDEQAPLYWKLYANNSSEKSEGGSKEDISQILDTFHIVEDVAIDDNVPSTSNDSRTFNSLSKTSEDENKK